MTTRLSKMDYTADQSSIIDDEKVQKALDWLSGSAQTAAKARAEREYLSEYTKSLRGRLMTEIKELEPKLAVDLISARAMSSDDYLTHLSALRIAIENDELMRWRRDAARSVLDAFQTMSANKRAERII